MLSRIDYSINKYIKIENMRENDKRINCATITSPVENSPTSYSAHVRVLPQPPQTFPT